MDQLYKLYLAFKDLKKINNNKLLVNITYVNFKKNRRCIYKF